MSLVMKKIIVAGAAGLLGSELVKALVDSGCKVIAMDLNTDKAMKRFDSDWLKAKSGLLVFAELDLNNEAGVKSFFASLTDVDGAVNATYPRNQAYGAHLFDVKLSDFNENLALHLGSAFLFMKECALYFKENHKSFSLVNVASIYGSFVPDFEIYEGTDMTMPVEYAAIKSSLLHLNRYVANYVGDSRFRINSVSPGGLTNNQSELFLKKYVRKTHGTGMLRASDITGTVKFLLSDDSNYITGQNLIIDDGFTL